MNTKILIVCLGTMGLVSACGQVETPTAISPEPVFDKFGGGSCEDGYTYVPGTVDQPQCVPDDGCIPTYDSAGAPIDCLPPPSFSEERDPGRSSTPGRSPTGGP